MWTALMPRLIQVFASTLVKLLDLLELSVFVSGSYMYVMLATA